jgi:hypothetical protein
MKNLSVLPLLLLVFSITSSKVYLDSTETVIKKASHVVIAEVVKTSHKGRYRFCVECTRTYKWVLSPKKILKGTKLKHKIYNFYYMVLINGSGPCPRLYFRTSLRAYGVGNNPKKGTRVIAALKRNNKGKMIVTGTFNIKELNKIKSYIN